MAVLVLQQHAEAASEIYLLRAAQMNSFQSHRTEILNEDK